MSLTEAELKKCKIILVSSLPWRKNERFVYIRLTVHLGILIVTPTESPDYHPA
jgi:hypothetical protein